MNLFNIFLDTVRKFGLEFYGRYYGTYPGIVVDNNDPDKLGKIQIKLPTILGPDKIHPTLAEPHFFNIASAQSGEFFPPYVNDVVDVFFENGDMNHPRYKGGRWETGEMPSDFLASYPNVRGWVFRSGQKVIIDETDGATIIRIVNADGSKIVLDGTAGGENITLTHKSGSTIKMDSDGSVLVNATSDVMVKASGDCTVNATNITLNAQAEATINANAEVSINSTGPVNISSDAIVSIAGGGEVAAGQILLFPNAISDFTGLPIQVPSATLFGSF